ncbi:caspase-7-like [Glandiceps talaboti]
MKQRVGTKVDAENVKSSFRRLGFDVTQNDDLTVHKMIALLEKVSKDDHRDHDCIAIIILSHGEEDVVYGTDGYVEVDQLTSYFSEDNCPSLAGKPKLFFMQACRGYEFDDGVIVKSDETDGVGIDSQSLNLEKDFLMAYATVNGYYSWRNRALGAWFIQALCDVFGRYGNTMDLMSMLTRVNNIVAHKFESSQGSKKQIPCAMSKLTKDLYFKPK